MKRSLEKGEMVLKKVSQRALMWFKSDLRVTDNPALRNASLYGEVIALYIISPQEWKSHDVAPIKVDFILRNLKKLRESLNELNIPLVVKQINHVKETPNLILNHCKEWNINAVFINKEYEVDESKRDLKVQKTLEENGFLFDITHDQCVVPPGRVLTKDGKPYSVFTPFKKAWIKILLAENSLIQVIPLPEPNIDQSLIIHQEKNEIPEKVEGFDISKKYDADYVRGLWAAGKEAAHKKLEQFSKFKILDYKKNRDAPALDGTSVISPFLAIGALGIRECLNEALIANKGLLDSGNEGAVTWISELCWREFYRHVLFHYPRVCMYQPFKLETKNIKWRDDPEGFEKWCKGETGYPIVDAGMRQLNKTGWMHNRSRMIAAMFLTKDLLIDWRKGEKYFMENLIDGDFASNNGGWQWSASTGTDSQPYFRVFNPLLQSQKNDPDGVFIKKWVPELKGLNKKQIHCPKDCLGASEFKKLNYPLPLVDHDMARKRAIDAFKNLKTDEEPKSAY